MMQGRTDYMGFGEQEDVPIAKFKMAGRKPYIIVGVTVGLIALILGIVIGYFGAPRPKRPAGPDGPVLSGVTAKIIEDADPSITERLIREMKAGNIESYLKNLTSRPHLAGTEADLRQALELKAFWEEQGLETVRVSGYDVLLSYPDKDNPNVITLRDSSTGSVIHQSQLAEKILRPEQNQSDVVPPFSAYSAPGTPKGQLVYVNYGRIEDFIWLKENKSIDVNGTIVIARYGQIFRADKVQNAQEYGAAGIILYTDPADYAVDGESSVYPDSWWLPGTGVQRGTVGRTDGDPLTQGYPAIESAYRHPESHTDLPHIPAHPIGYDDAHAFLSNMSGEEVPASWRGKLPITYRFGPGFVNTSWEIQMNISTSNKMATTYNVFGYIKGSVESDRYVLIGNHRDAWVFGALDPSSGQAVMMELSRALAHLVQQGWRPRRTIVFCSWGAEEYGLIGSTEWVEEYIKNLGERAVSYLNIDIAVQGNFSLRAHASPLLYSLLYDAAKQIPNPDPDEFAAGRKSLYDTWLHRFPKTAQDGKPAGVPVIGNLASGSDYATFLERVGIPSLDTRYTYDTSSLLDYPVYHTGYETFYFMETFIDKEFKFNIPTSSYPLYHSAYELFHLFKSYIDPGFKYSLSVGQFWGEMARRLADSLVLPLNVREYSTALQGFTVSIEKNFGALMAKQGVSLDGLKSAVGNFTVATENFEKRSRTINRKNPIAVRAINDQMMQLERAFIDPQGLPDRPLMRHIVFAPSSHDSYSGVGFPGLLDALWEIEKDADPAARWEKVKEHLSVVIFTVQSAASTLDDVTSFQRQ